MMTLEFTVSVQVYSLNNSLKQHTALEFLLEHARERYCVEAIYLRQFQCCLCNDSTWFTHENMKTHLEIGHDMHVTGERFDDGCFRSKKVYTVMRFLDHHTHCEGAKLQSVSRLGKIKLSETGYYDLCAQWGRDLEKSKYDPVTNNCNHQVRRWCKCIGVKSPPTSTNLAANVIGFLCGSLYG